MATAFARRNGNRNGKQTYLNKLKRKQEDYGKGELCGFKLLFLFSLLVGEDEPILTRIFFQMA